MTSATEDISIEINTEAFAKLAEHPMFKGTVDEMAQRIREKANKAATVERNWYELDAPWDNLREVEGKLLELGQSTEWLELVSETSHLTHATANEVWDGMARALVDYLEGLR